MSLGKESCTGSGVSGDVRIEYSTDRDVSWKNIVSTAANDGSYGWTVVDAISDNCLVRISAGETDEKPTDVSDGVFSIAPPL